MVRLVIKQETIKKLYLYSGNECAFPGCSARIIDDEGDVVAQLAHIEAAEEGGPRYNDSQSDEERRHFDNLLYLCYLHHKKTDGPTYTVEKMKDMKRRHEARFGDHAVRRMQEALQDLTELVSPEGSFSLGRLTQLEEYAFEVESLELRTTSEGVREFASQLSDIPLQHRSLLRILLEKGAPTHDRPLNYEMPIHELEERIGMGYAELGPRLNLLERRGFVEIEAEYNEFPMLQTRDQYASITYEDGRTERFDTGIWELLVDFCRETGVPLTTFFNDLKLLGTRLASPACPAMRRGMATLSCRCPVRAFSL
jgi:hypothetical protein